MTGIFISYASEDEDTAKKLEDLLQGHGIHVWRDRESIYAGQQWPKAIGEGIAGQKIFLLLWSKNAEVSHFVEFEWNRFLVRHFFYILINWISGIEEKKKGEKWGGAFSLTLRHCSFRKKITV